MWISWFGGFAEPSDYSNAEMPDINLPALIISSIFAVPYLAFLIILPGVREKRLITLAVFTEVALVGAALAISLNFPGWTGGSARIVAQFRSHVNERMRARVGVHVGLTNINITLRFEEMVEMDRSQSRIDMSQVYYNENFDISGVSSMASELRSAYLRGLPYPILSIMEYFSLNQDAFDWGRHYRTAGHYTSAAVSFSLACWLFAVVCLLFIPHKFGMSMLATGLAALLACLLYRTMSPCHLEIGFVGTQGNRVLMEMSFQSESSFDSAHSGLRIPRSLSDLTIFKENIRPPRFKDDSDFVLSVTRF
uniref:Dual oxidase maturation factor 1-like n=1 Tax=Angiostrongylus cantonensis TaxID=6313 RepID=A0A0K0CU16_ANGCA